MAKERESRTDGFDDYVVKIRRCAAVVKGGRRFSFNALVVVGDKGGRVAAGYGKANEVPPSVEKAIKDGSRSMIEVSMLGTTIPHQVQGRFGAARVVLVPAAPGTGARTGSGPWSGATGWGPVLRAASLRSITGSPPFRGI